MNRYYGRNRFQYVMKSRRSRPFLMILVVILVLFLLYRLTVGGWLDEANYENQRNAKLRSEVQHALSQTNSLSNLGDTRTGGALGKIRQYVHGMEVINELNVGMYGEVGRLYIQSVFDNIYRIIDEYDAKLNSGANVNDSLATLRAAIEELTAKTTSVLEN